MIVRTKSILRIAMIATFGLSTLTALTGCQKSDSSTLDKKSFTAAPDYNKLTPEQKKMVDQFSHHSGPPTTAAH